MRLLHRCVVVCAAVLAAAPMLAAVAPAAQADPLVAVAGQIQLSEVESNGGHPDDWIELHNLTGTDLSLAGWWLQDSSGTSTTGDHYDIATESPGGTTIPANGYRAFDVDWDYVDHMPNGAKDSTAPQYFGLGAADSARVYDPTNTLVDQVDWTAHADDPITGGGSTKPDATYSRCPGSHGESGWVVTDSSTKAVANTSCPAAATVDADLAAELHVNEVMADNTIDANGVRLPDWIELTNTGTVSQDISGWILSDDNAADADYLPPGTVVDQGAHPWWYVGDQTSTDPYYTQDIFRNQTFPGKTNKDFGISKTGDNAALLFPDAHDVDRVSFGADSAAVVAAAPTGETIGRCPDGTGSWTVTVSPSAGATNTCANPVDSQVKINEVDTATGVVELENTSASTADVSGLKITDAASQTYSIPTATTIAAGAVKALTVGGSVHFAASGDTATLLDGTAVVDSTSWTHALATSWGRCPDGTGTFTDTAAATDGAANDCAAPTPSGYDAIRVNEIETNGDENGDWIELTNIGSSAVNISGMILADNGGDNGADDGDVSGHSWPIPGTDTDPADTTTAGNTVLAAGGYVAFYSDTQFGFGLGQADMARLFTPSHVLVDSTSWTQHESGVTYERCPLATQGVVFRDTADNAPFVNSWTNSPGAANDCLPPIRINEVQASDPAPGGHDWVELTNVGDQPVDISNYVLTDDSDAASHEYLIGATNLDNTPSTDVTTLGPGAFASYDVDNTNHDGNFGLGSAGDEVRLYEPGAYDSTTHTYDNDDLVDSFVFEDTSAKTGDTELPRTVTLPNGSWPVNAADPTSAQTYARCGDGTSQIVADGTGQWEITSTPTKGAANRCDGLLTTTPWPDTHHGQADATADSVDLGQNMSGLVYVAGATPADDYMWGIENGTTGLPGANPGDAGELFKLVPGGDGSGSQWGPAVGWEKGVPLRYQDGQGQPDTEGVTAVHGQVFAVSERDNADNAVSKNAITEYDPNHLVPNSGDADGDLVANHEWDLGPVLGPGGTANTGLNAADPGDANLGIEGIAMVPDTYLTAHGFLDQSTGRAYDPADYPHHIDGGVFFVAMEKTGKLYGFELNSDDTFTWISTASTGFPTIMDLLWDPARQALWADCDNSCQGRTSLLTLDTANDAGAGTFQPATVYERPTGATTNLNNEGFTEQPASECVDGSKSVWWSDDSDDDSHWLRTAAVDCTPPPDGEAGATVTTSLSGVPAGSGSYAGPVTASFTCTDVDAVLNQPCPGPVTVTSSQGATTVATLTDTLGLTHAATIPAIDIEPANPGGGTSPGGGTTPPSAAHITVSGPTGWVRSTSATFTFSSSDSGVTGFRCELVGADTAFTACAGSYRKAGLADGAYTFEVEALDAAGDASDPVDDSFSVDAHAPAVHVTGVTKDATYVGVGPKPACTATDAGSGVASCTLAVTRTPTTVRVTARATDTAGNAATTSVSYRTVPFYVDGTAYRDGTFTVRSGQAYTVVALTTGSARPRLLGPVAAGRKLTGRGTAFAPAGSVDGLHRFTARKKITVGSGTARLGVEVGGTLHVIELRR